MQNLIPQAYAIDIESEFKLGTKSIYPNLGVVVSSLLQNVFTIAGVVFFIFLIFGGVTYILNAGKGDQEGIEKSKNALTAAVMGLILIFLAYWLVQIFQFVTGKPLIEKTGV